MKVIMVNPSGYRASFDSFTPLGLISLATVIHGQDCKVTMEIIDLYKEYASGRQDMKRSFQTNIEEDARYILSKKPDAVGIYAMCNTLHSVLLLADKLRELAPEVRIMLGGPQATIAAKSILENCSFIDAIGLGEGETTILGICKALETGDFKNATGVAFREQEKVVLRYADTLIEDLDQLPLIDFDLYPYPLSDAISLDVGRGCPFSCTFCSTKLFWKQRYRIKTPKRIFDEIEFYHNKYGVKHYPIVHDLFTLDKEAIRQFCNLIIDHQTDIRWTCSSRLDTVDEELLQRMSEAHCTNIFFGVESGSARMQRVLHKNLDLKKLPVLYKLCRETKIGTTFSFMYGFPQETRSDVSDTLNLIYRIWDMGYEEYKKKKLSIRMNRLIFLSGTELTAEYQDQMVLMDSKVREAYGEADDYYKAKLEPLIQNKEMFPHYYQIPSRLSKELNYLELYVNILMEYGLLKLFDITYKLLLLEAGRDNLELFYMLRIVFDDEEMEKLSALFYSSYAEFIEDLIVLLDRFIEQYPFGVVDYSLLQSIYAYEKDIYQDLYASGKDWTHRTRAYAYDVFNMKRFRQEDAVKEPCIVCLKRDSNKISVSRKMQPEYTEA